MRLGRRSVLRAAAGLWLPFATSAAWADGDEPKVRREEPKVGGTRYSSGPYAVYTPSWLAPKNGKVDVVVHFHGMSELQEANFAEAQLNAVAVSINLGVSAGSYGSFTHDPEPALKSLLDHAISLPGLSNVALGSVGRVALSAWSAGYGSVGPLLRSKAVRDRVDAVLLADGLFTSFLDRRMRKIHADPLRGTIAFAEAATKGERLFILTHTSIATADYPSVWETADYVLHELQIGKRTIPHVTQRPIYEAKKGLFTVLGYAGVTRGAHVDQIKFMGANMYKPLAERWK